MTLGVLGGTFNPIHLAHLRVAIEVREALRLERVLLVPSADPPHKAEALAPAQDRLEMARLAAAADPDLEVMDLELRRAGPSYTVDTLRELARSFPQADLWFILGSDAFAAIDSWREPMRLLELASFAVVLRPGSEGRSLAALVPPVLAAGMRETSRGLLAPSGRELRLVEVSRLDISASDIRRRIARGASIRHLVPEAVREYIAKYGLYKENA